jgi:hypothetical protein
LGSKPGCGLTVAEYGKKDQPDEWKDKVTKKCINNDWFWR